MSLRAAVLVGVASAALAACQTAAPDPSTDDLGLGVTGACWVSTSPDTSSFTFDTADVLRVAQDIEGTIYFSQSPTADTAPITLSIRAEGPAGSVRRDGDDADPSCRPGPELRVPVRGTLSLGGDLSAGFTGVLDVAQLDASAIWFGETDSHAIKLSPAWQAAVDDAEHETGGTQDELRVFLHGTWSQPEVRVHVRGARGDGVVWRGTVR